MNFRMNDEKEAWTTNETADDRLNPANNLDLKKRGKKQKKTWVSS